MNQIVAGISMSHAPGIIGWPETVAPAIRDRMFAAIRKIADYLDQARPDVVVAFTDDHFENIYRNLAPTFAIGVADSHQGPPDYFMAAMRFSAPWQIPGEPELARALLENTVHAGFDVARMGSVDYGNNIMAPWPLIRPQNDIPIIPVFINAYNPPLPTMERAYVFGERIRTAIENAPGNRRVAILATGGLSHWPPIWLEHVREYHPMLRDYMQKAKRFQTEGRSVLKEYPDLMNEMAQCEQNMAKVMERPLVNPEWDLAFLDKIASGDSRAVRAMSYDEIEQGGGFGGHEVLNWAAAMGAMGGAKATVLNYEAVPEWICGMGYVVYDR